MESRENFNMILYCPSTKTYSKISNKMNFNEILYSIILFDLNNPFFIEIIDNYSLFEKLMKKLNHEGEIIIRSIDIENKSQEFNIDTNFLVLKDFIFLNFNSLVFCPYFENKTKISNIGEITKINLKLFFFKNILIYYNHDRSSYFFSVINEKMHFTEIKNNKLFFQLNKNNVKGYAYKEFKDSGKVDPFISDVSDLSGNSVHSEIDNRNIFLKEGFESDSDDEMKVVRNFSRHTSVAFSPQNQFLLQEVQKIKTLNKFHGKFRLSLFYFFIFEDSFSNLEKFTKILNSEGETLKNMYLDVEIKDTKTFYARLLQYEEQINTANHELNIKQKFVKSFLDSCHKKDIFRVVSFSQFSENQNKSKKFKDRFKFILNTFQARIKEIERNLNKFKTNVKMIKQSFRILFDDSKYFYTINYGYVIFFIVLMSTLIEDVFISTSSMFGMNILVPWKYTDSYWPFIFIICVVVSVILAEFIIIYKKVLKHKDNN